jgi:hypothetical protein
MRILADGGKMRIKCGYILQENKAGLALQREIYRFPKKLGVINNPLLKIKVRRIRKDTVFQAGKNIRELQVPDVKINLTEK